jgi:hypothetical protein
MLANSHLYRGRTVAKISRPGWVALIGLKIVCCAALIAAATGTLGLALAWFTGSGLLWIGGLAALALAGYGLFMRRGACDARQGTRSAPASR